MKTPFVRTNRRILIIDDTPSIHEDFRKILGPRRPKVNRPWPAQKKPCSAPCSLIG